MILGVGACSYLLGSRVAVRVVGRSRAVRFLPSHSAGSQSDSFSSSSAQGPSVYHFPRCLMGVDFILQKVSQPFQLPGHPL